MRVDHALSPWTITGPVFHAGGRQIVRRAHAPLGRVLGYRRAAGEPPPSTTGAALFVDRGWSVDLGEGGLGDVLLGPALVRALVEATGHTELTYTGPRPDLLRRCSLPIDTVLGSGSHRVRTHTANPVPVRAIPEKPPTWLDILDDNHVEVHAALPMRYYLTTEQALGVRLPASHAPTPTFASTETVRPFHVVFVSATSWPERKDFGVGGFATIAAALTERRAEPWTFTLIPGHNSTQCTVDGMDVLYGQSTAECVDLFATAELVIGNDTGLTHLAALTTRADGTGPQVVGLHGRHAHTNWTTGSERHHAVATPFAQMVAAADRCPVRDQLDDALWAVSSSLADLPADDIAKFAGHQAGWW